MALFHHQETVINPAHIVALRTEHSLSGGRFVVAIYPVGGGSSRIQLVMTIEERGRLIEAMEAVSHDYNIAVAPADADEAAARFAAMLTRHERALDGAE